MSAAQAAWAVMLVQVGCCVFMTGLCAFVAVVHYPLMARVGREQWREYELAHTARTGLVVAPAMLLELASCAWLLSPSALGWGAGMMRGFGPWAWASAALLAACWAITFLVNVPQHNRLSNAWDGATHRQLVATHWVRTACWFARSLLLLGMLWQGLSTQA